MAKSTSGRDGKPGSGAKQQPKRQADQKSERQGRRKIDIVEQAGKESFPASDPPPWNP